MQEGSRVDQASNDQDDAKYINTEGHAGFVCRNEAIRVLDNAALFERVSVRQGASLPHSGEKSQPVPGIAYSDSFFWLRNEGRRAGRLLLQTEQEARNRRAYARVLTEENQVAAGELAVAHA